MPQAPPEPSVLLPTELMWSTARALSLELSDAELGAAIERVFDGLGLSDAALSPLHTLSGGKRQLVGLALALIRDPDLLLLDEPTSALDLHWRMVVLDTVRERLRTQGGAAVAALHDLDLAARYCDHIALIHHGRVVAAGSPGEVLTTDNLAAVYRVEAEVAMDDQGRPTITVLRPIR
jgi:iron complex transport system ATP-binding protein